MKNIVVILIVLFIGISVKAQKKEKTYKVLASCGQCQFGMRDSEGCDLAIQISGKHYWVKGSSLQDHGDEHAEDGMCKAVRKAKVVGKIEGDSITVSQFVILKK